MAECRTCSAPILWLKSDAGKWTPVDPAPVDGGNLQVDLNARTFRVVSPMAALDLGPVLRVSHFSTCPDADLHRQGDNNAD